MTEVLSIQQPNGPSSFGTDLRRTSSNSSLHIPTAPSYSTQSPYLNGGPGVSYEYGGGVSYTASSYAPSSSTSSPESVPHDFSGHPSYTSSPPSSLSLNGYTHQDDAEESYFPPYDDCDYYNETEHAEPAPSPEASSVTPTNELPPIRTSAISWSHLYDPAHATGDDMASRPDPSAQVDFLSHAWREEDIWASWRHVVRRRKCLANGYRLENASWRTWGKCKYQLQTLGAEDLNWMKDHDVTWLYGPLQTGPRSLGNDSALPSTQVSRSDSFGLKKPILKKRSISEVMLQRSLSSSTLMKEATDALRAQQLVISSGGSSKLGERKVSDFISWSGADTPLTRVTTHTNSSDASISSTSGTQTPSTRRHIHFNDKVEQCIAINCDNEDHSLHSSQFLDDEDSSDDEMLTMQPTGSQRRNKRPSTPRNSFSNDGKTIAMLPSTTLNCRGDTPEPDNDVSCLGQSGYPQMSAASQLLARTSTPAPRSRLDEADEDDDADMDWQPSAGRRDSVWQPGGIRIQSDSEDEGEEADDDTEMRGMRRTPSGMFMPYDEENDYPTEGIIGRVVDTVNTARDIAHVIWNVGWRGSD